MDSGLGEQRFLVTGASGGIGGVLAAALAAEGAHLVLHAHRGLAAATRLAERLAAVHHVRAHALAADLRDESSVADLFTAAIDTLGGLDGLVANAGAWPAEAVPLHRMTLAQWQATLLVNLTGAFLSCRGFLRHLAERPRESAAIVVVSSTAGVFGEEGHADYAASKAALHGLVLTLKNEIVRLAPRGRVNAVCPGWVATPMAASALADQATVDRVTATMALRKVAQPEDVARAITFLLSDRLAGHLSGTLLALAGGMEGRLLHPAPAVAP